MSRGIDGWQGVPSPELRQAMSGDGFTPGAWVDVVEGDRIVAEIVIPAEEDAAESAWLFVLAVERTAALLEQYGFCGMREFVLKFRAAAELVAARPPKNAKRDALKDTFPF